jgi:hypothetical protein
LCFGDPPAEPVPIRHRFLRIRPSDGMGFYAGSGLYVFQFGVGVCAAF